MMRVIYFSAKILIAVSFFSLLAPKSALADEATVKVTISEIGAYETSDNEWVEIYNFGETAVDLNGWKFYEEQTNHTLKEHQGDLIIEPGEYAIIANKPELFLEKHPSFAGTVIDSSWSSLKESGEEIGLKDNTGASIEIFNYLPAPDTSLQKINLSATDYSEANWQAHPQGNTAGGPNDFTVASENTSEENASTETGTGPESPTDQSDGELLELETPKPDAETSASIESKTPVKSARSASPKPAAPKKIKPPIILNEIFPNPAGPDEVYEFIELKNTGAEPYELNNWTITTYNFSFLIPRVTFAGGQILAFMRPQTNLALNNKKDSIKLLDSAGVTIDAAKYDEPFEENVSYQRFGDQWKQTARPTREQENIYAMPDLPPVIWLDCPKEISLGQSFICDISDSFDPNGQPLSANWRIFDKNGELPDLHYYGNVPEIIINDARQKNLEINISDGSRLTLKTYIFNVRGEKEYYGVAALESASEPTQLPPDELTPLIQVEDLPSGSPVIVQGVVAKNLKENSRTLYIGEPEAKLLITNDYWPPLQAGDIVTISGKTGRQNGEAIIRVASIDGLIAVDSPMIQEVTVEAAEAIAKDNGQPQPVDPPLAISDAPNKSSHRIWYIIGGILTALIALYYKIKQFSPATLRVNGKAAME